MMQFLDTIPSQERSLIHYSASVYTVSLIFLSLDKTHLS